MKTWKLLISLAGLLFSSTSTADRVIDSLDSSERFDRLEAFVGTIGKRLCKKNVSDFEDGHCAGLAAGLGLGLSLYPTYVPKGRTYIKPGSNRPRESQKDQDFSRGERRGIVDAIVEKFYFHQRLDYGANALEAQHACSRRTIHEQLVDLIAGREDLQKKGVHISVLEAINACQSAFSLDDSGFYRPFTIAQADVEKLRPVLDPYLGLHSLQDKSGKTITKPIFTVFRPSKKYAVAATGRKKGILSMDGSWIVPPLFAALYPDYLATTECGQDTREIDFLEFRYATVMNDDGKWGYINSQGKMLIDYLYDYPLSFTNGSANARLGSEVTPINIRGEPIPKACEKEIVR